MKIKGVEMIPSFINGEFDIVLPKHRADRPEWYTESGWEKKRIQSLHGNLSTKDTLFYVGSEEGDIPALCQMFGAKLVLFEPNDRVWANTKAIWDANNLSYPTCFPGFAGNKTDNKGRPVYINSFPPEADGEIIPDHAFKELFTQGDTLPQVKIDDFVKDTGIIPTAITTDCEGSDWEVLKGAEETLRMYHPKLWISWHPEFMFRMFDDYTAEARKWVMDLGYTEIFIDYPLHELHMMYENKLSIS